MTAKTNAGSAESSVTHNEPSLSNEQTERMRTLAQGGDKDAERVLTLAKAADRENAEAQFYLAHSLQEGELGLTRDPERARKLFARAAEHGYARAQQELDRQRSASKSSPSLKHASATVNLPSVTTQRQEPVRFDDAIIRLAVRAYVLSIPMFFKENDLIPLMAANKVHFIEGGMVIEYLKTAGSAMAQSALAFHGDSSAQSMFGYMTPDMHRMAGQVDAQMRSQGVALGQDFLWLAQVLPSAAEGNYAPFQAQSQLSPLRQQMLVAVQMFKMDPQMAQPLIAQMQQKLPMWEQEVYDNVTRLDIALPADYRRNEPPSEPVPMHTGSDRSAGREVGENALPGSRSQNEAADQYREAAEQGNAMAQNNLGAMYELGQGVAQDAAKAADWYRKAAAQGLALAQNNLGALYLNGRGVAQDDAKAVDLFRKAAEQGLPLAQNNLGLVYLNGRGVPQDDTKAVDWFRKAAEQELARAQSNLGAMYMQGRGVEQNDAEAVKWFRKSAEQGCAEGQTNLALAYTYGRGVEKNDAEAAKWYRKAADQGHTNAQGQSA